MQPAAPASLPPSAASDLSVPPVPALAPVSAAVAPAIPAVPVARAVGLAPAGSAPSPVCRHVEPFFLQWPHPPPAPHRAVASGIVAARFVNPLNALPLHDLFVTSSTYTTPLGKLGGIPMNTHFSRFGAFYSHAVVRAYPTIPNDCKCSGVGTSPYHSSCGDSSSSVFVVTDLLVTSHANSIV